MMIYMIGSHGTGKSSVLQQIRKYTGKFASDGMSRPLIRAGLDLKMDPLAFQYLLDDLTIQHQKSFLDFKNDVFFTRNVIDCIAYAHVNKLKGYDEKKCVDFLNQIKQQSIFFYFSIEFPLEADSERSDDVEYQKAVDKEIIRLIEKYDILVRPVTGTVIQRAEHILWMAGYGRHENGKFWKYPSDHLFV